MPPNQENHSILWQDSYSVKIEVIDEQHKHFVGIMNELHDVVMSLGSPTKLNKIMDELAQHVAVHFATEEELFTKYDYPEGKKHIQAHNELKAKLTSYKEKINNGQDIAIDLLDFIEDWFVYHLQYFDQKYSKFLIDKGVH